MRDENRACDKKRLETKSDGTDEISGGEATTRDDINGKSDGETQ